MAPVLVQPARMLRCDGFGLESCLPDQLSRARGGPSPWPDFSPPAQNPLTLIVKVK